jgi:hypothetical protein
LGHIDDFDAVAAKHQPLSALANPLHRNKCQYKELSDILGLSTKIEIMLTSVKARSALWDAAVFGG